MYKNYSLAATCKFLFALFSVLSCMEPASAQPCSLGTEGRIVIMLDRSGSISAQDLENEKAAVSGLIDRFSAVTPRPSMSVGVIGDPTRDETPEDSAAIIAGLTKDYASLKTAVSNITPGDPSWATNLAQTLAVARTELAKHPENNQAFVILISDGLADRPGFPLYKDCGACGCDHAFATAAQEADALEAAPVNAKIFAIYFSGHGAGTLDCAAQGEPAHSKAFMQNEIASKPAGIYSQEGNLDLTNIFNAIASTLVCDDKDACTRDICSGQQCVYEPYPPGNPATSIDRCGVCGGDGESCLGCKVTQSTSDNLTKVKGAVKKEHAAFVKLSAVTGKAKKDAKTKKYIAQKKAKALKDLNSCLAKLDTYPSPVKKCTNTHFCATRNVTAPGKRCITSAKNIRSSAFSLAAKVPRSAGGNYRKAQSLKKTADSWHRKTSKYVSEMPSTASICD